MATPWQVVQWAQPMQGEAAVKCPWRSYLSCEDPIRIFQISKSSVMTRNSFPEDRLGNSSPMGSSHAAYTKHGGAMVRTKVTTETPRQVEGGSTKLLHGQVMAWLDSWITHKNRGIRKKTKIFIFSYYQVMRNNPNVGAFTVGDIWQAAWRAETPW